MQSDMKILFFFTKFALETVRMYRYEEESYIDGSCNDVGSLW